MTRDPASAEQSIRIRYIVLVVANLLSSAIGFATASLIAFRFEAKGFGEVSLAIAIVGQALVVSQFGSEIFAVRSVAAGTHTVARMASSVALVRLALGVPTYAAVLGLAYFVPALAEVRPLLLILGLSVFTSAASVVWVSQAAHRTSIFALTALAIEVLYFGGLYTGLEFDRDIRLVPLARIVAEALAAIAVLIWMYRSVGPFGRPLSPRALWALLRSAAPIGGTQFFRGVALGSDLIVLGFFVEFAEVGHYSGAYKIFMGLTGLSSAYFVILLPRVAELHADPQAMRAEIQSSFRRILPLFVAGATLVGIAAKPTLELLFGESFGAAAPSLRLLCAALVVSTIYRHYRQVLIARGLQHIDFRTSVTCGVAHIALKLVFVPFLGIPGAALGTLLAELYLVLAQRYAALQSLRETSTESASSNF